MTDRDFGKTKQMTNWSVSTFKGTCRLKVFHLKLLNIKLELSTENLKQDALGSVTGLHYDSKYFRIAKENGELCMLSGSLNITMTCPRFS